MTRAEYEQSIPTVPNSGEISRSKLCTMNFALRAVKAIEDQLVDLKSRRCSILAIQATKRSDAHRLQLAEYATELQSLLEHRKDWIDIVKSASETVKIAAGAGEAMDRATMQIELPPPEPPVL